MKVTFIVISLTYFFAVNALPVTTDGSDEVEVVPIEDQFGFGGQPIVDTGIVGGTSFSPFDDIFPSFEGIMNRLREQMSSLLRGLSAGNDTEIASIPGLHFPNIDLGKGNSTSVTKIINGHKVVINETEYKQENDMGGAFVKVRVIDVLPDSSEITTERDAEPVSKPNKDVEAVENSFENEIPKNKEIEDVHNIEIVHELDSAPSQTIKGYSELDDSLEQIESNVQNSPYYLLNSAKYAEIEPLENFEDNNIEERPMDLSSDTYVNDLLINAGAPINPDAEIFDMAAVQESPQYYNISPR